MSRNDDEEDPTHTVRVWWLEESGQPEVFTRCTEVDLDNEGSVDIEFTDSSGKRHQICCAAFELKAE